MRLSSLRNLGIILEKTSAPFESQAVCNPTCIEKDGVVHMFYRAIAPRNRSSIGYCQIKDGKVIQRSAQPILVPEYEYEKQGVEDPRIVFFEGLYYLFYTAYDGVNALVAYATSPDLTHFTKKGLITPTILNTEVREILKTLPDPIYGRYIDNDTAKDAYVWEKDAFIFPERINGKLMLVHRIMPGIQCIPFSNFSELTNARWKDYFKRLSEHIILDPLFPFENEKIGGGCPPINTEAGWLLIYHAVEKNRSSFIYHAAAALLDRSDPTKVIGRLPYPLFSPQEEWEKNGDVHDVVFPSGAVVRGDELIIYYGAADTRIGAKSLSMSELITELKNNP